MGSYLEVLLVALRAGRYFIVRLNLAVGVVGVLTARLWNPSAPMDEVVAVVTLPPIVTYIAVRVLGAILSGRKVAGADAGSEGAPRPAQIPPSSTKLLPPPGELSIRKGLSFVWLARLMIYALNLVAISFSVVLALPFYVWFGLDWAISYGLLMAAVMFALGVFTLLFALSQLAPSVWQGMKSAVWPVVSRLLPRPASSR